MSVALRVGTRGSALALSQSRQMVERLEAAGNEVELSIIRTSGDKMKDVALAKVGGKGLFLKELEEALKADHIDLAVHSMKDVPAELPQGFALGAITARVDERDVLVRAAQHLDLPPGLSALPRGSRIGTGSLRRRAQIAVLRPDLEVVPIRGNVDTRLALLESGTVDAVVLAAAGIARLGLDVPVDPFPPEVFLPAAGQGILAIEIRAGDAQTRMRLLPVHDTAAASAATAERALVQRLGASCTAPVAAWCRSDAGEMICDGLVASLDGSEVLRATRRGHDDETALLGQAVADDLLDRGARTILDEVDRVMSASTDGLERPR